MNITTSKAQSLKPKAQSLKPKAAFTLIELLVVVAIIAVLISILLPALGQAREKARQGVCGSQNKQIALAVQMYAQDHNDLMVARTDHYVPSGQSANWVWAGSLYREDYLPRVYPMGGQAVQQTIPTVTHCPSSPRIYSAGGGIDKAGNYFVTNINYAMNASLTFYKPGSATDGEPEGEARVYKKLGKVESPARTIFIYDAPPADSYIVTQTIWPQCNYTSSHRMGLGAKPIFWVAPNDTGEINLQQNYSAAGRHSGGTNILFVDGHVEWLGTGMHELGGKITMFIESLVPTTGRR